MSKPSSYHEGQFLVISSRIKPARGEAGLPYCEVGGGNIFCKWYQVDHPRVKVHVQESHVAQRAHFSVSSRNWHWRGHSRLSHHPPLSLSSLISGAGDGCSDHFKWKLRFSLSCLALPHLKDGTPIFFFTSEEDLTIKVSVPLRKTEWCLWLLAFWALSKVL